MVGAVAALRIVIVPPTSTGAAINLTGRAPCRVASGRSGSRVTPAASGGYAEGASVLVGNGQRKSGAIDMMEKTQGAVRTLLASALVQCCEAVDGSLVRWRKDRVAALRANVTAWRRRDRLR
jgi:hypothetical protein